MSKKAAKTHINDVLTDNERQYCALRARGENKSQSYRQAYNHPRLDPKDASSRACEIERRPRVTMRIRELVDHASKQDLLTHGRYVQGLLDDLEACRQASNYTAAASVQRLLGQAIGSLTDNVHVREMADPSIVVEKLRGILDETALAALETRLRAKETFH